MRRSKDSRMPHAVQPQQLLCYPSRIYKKQEKSRREAGLSNYVAILLTGFKPSPCINECFINLCQLCGCQSLSRSAGLSQSKPSKGTCQSCILPHRGYSFVEMNVNKFICPVGATLNVVVSKGAYRSQRIAESRLPTKRSY
jgi:hypothetical protein